MVSASEPSTAMRCRDPPLHHPGYFARRTDRSPSSGCALSPFEDELAQVAPRWGRYASPLVIMAHTVRAILLANATAATFRGRRCARANNHAVACREPGLTSLMTAVAPSTSN